MASYFNAYLSSDACDPVFSHLFLMRSNSMSIFCVSKPMVQPPCSFILVDGVWVSLSDYSPPRPPSIYDALATDD